MRKTTIELADALLRDAKKVAVEERTSVKALIEQGLRLVIRERLRRRGFKLRRASFKGDGLVAGPSPASPRARPNGRSRGRVCTNSSPS